MSSRWKDSGRLEWDHIIGEANRDESYQKHHQRYIRSGIGTYILAQELIMHLCSDVYAMVQSWCIWYGAMQK
jgi:hypothetical protein